MTHDIENILILSVIALMLYLEIKANKTSLQIKTDDVEINLKNIDLKQFLQEIPKLDTYEGKPEINHNYQDSYSEVINTKYDTPEP
jgi:hypothetical protein